MKVHVRTKEGVSSPGAGITLQVIVSPPDMDAGN